MGLISFITPSHLPKKDSYWQYSIDRNFPQCFPRRYKPDCCYAIVRSWITIGNKYLWGLHLWFRSNSITIYIIDCFRAWANPTKFVIHRKKRPNVCIFLNQLLLRYIYPPPIAEKKWQKLIITAVIILIPIHICSRICSKRVRIDYNVVFLVEFQGTPILKHESKGVKEETTGVSTQICSSAG